MTFARRSCNKEALLVANCCLNWAGSQPSAVSQGFDISSLVDARPVRCDVDISTTNMNTSSSAEAEAEVEEESRDEERGDGPARDLSGSGGRLRLRRVPCRRVSEF